MTTEGEVGVSIQNLKPKKKTVEEGVGLGGLGLCVAKETCLTTIQSRDCGL